MPKHKPLLAKSDYEVGYGKPPKQNRFQKGVSGNPAGRPKGAKNKAAGTMERLKAIIMTEAYREVDISEKGSMVAIPIAQAVMRAVGVNAAKGKIGAQRLFLESLGAVEAADRRDKQELFGLAKDYKKRKTEEIERAVMCELPIPIILPHPDDIELNMSTGEVLFHGPVSDDDLAIWNQWWAEKSQHEQEAADWRETLARAAGAADAEYIEESLDWSIYLLKLTALKIMRRWHLPAGKVVEDFVFKRVLEQHVEENTTPEPPNGYVHERFDWNEMYQKRERYLRDATAKMRRRERDSQPGEDHEDECRDV